MSEAKETSKTAREPAPQGPGVVSSGWLAAQSTFEHHEDRKLGPAVVSSVVLHVGLFFLVVLLLSYQPARESLPPPPPPDYDIVYLQEPGPGGGGGGSPDPAPPRPIEIPETTPPEPVPVEPEPEVTPPPPIPILDAPILTNSATVVRATGSNSVALADYGGGGRGRGIGPGTGPGVGPGSGGGTGGGPRRPGSGIAWPVPIRQPPPTYTSEGMRAKVQGIVVLDAVVLESGRIGDVEIVKSLDRQHGLDEAAIAAAKLWEFRPCTQQGEPVPCKITIELEFRIH